MFQSTADIDNQNIDVNNKVLYRLKKIFKTQNIVVYILTFLMSTLSIKGQIMPFGIAMIAACVGESIPLIGVFISAILGTLVGNGSSELANMLIVLAVYLILVLFTKSKVAIEERNEEVKSGGKLLMAYFIVSLIKKFVGIFLMYDVFTSVLFAFVTYSFYKIFVNGLSIIKDFNVKKAFTIEELIAGVLIISLASLSLSKIPILPLNISNVIIILMIMILGWKNGILVGAAAGASVGLATCVVQDVSLIQVLMFSVSGMLSGALNKFGKVGVILGFILGNAILTYWVRGATTIIIYIREILFASIGLIFIPKTIKINIEDIYNKEKMLDNMKDNRLEEGKKTDISQRLKNISDMFSNFMNNQSVKEVENSNIEHEFIENLKEIKDNMFFEEIVDTQNGISKEICSTLVKNDALLDSDLIDILKNHNNFFFENDEKAQEDIKRIVKIANKTLKIVQIDNVRAQERKKNLEAFNDEITTVTKVIDRYVDNISSDVIEDYSDFENEIIQGLNKKNIDTQDCIVKQIENQKYIIEIKLDYNDLGVRDKESISKIAEIMSKEMATRIAFQRERIDDEKKEYRQVYSSEDKYILQVGSGKITKEGSSVSGDCSLQIKLADGKYLLAIADGMGSGEKAREYSKLALRLIKQLLSAGFNKEDSIKLINSRLNMIGDAEKFSSLDVSILDLYAGKIEILKSGASNTYIRNNRKILKVQSESMPLGIVNNVEIKSKTVDVEDGQIIVMCSDGVVDSKDDEGAWLEEFLKNVKTNSVQKIVDLILAEALDNNSGISQDDMTVIVSKIVKRK